MEMQNQIKEYVAQYEKEVRKLADQLRNECMPQPTEELFSESVQYFFTRIQVTVHITREL